MANETKFNFPSGQITKRFTDVGTWAAIGFQSFSPSSPRAFFRSVSLLDLNAA